MPKTKISEFSATPASNTDIDSINIAEGCAPSGINDAIRELMAQLKDFQTGAVGDSFNGPVGTTTAAAGAFTTLAASGAVTLSGGTANGVTYLNGSKVLTSGSALTFSGTNLGVSGNGAFNTGASGGVISGTSTYSGYFSALGGGSGAIISITPDTISGANGATYNTSFVSGGSGPHVFQIGGTERMRLTSTGLGIGTSSPAYKLDILVAATGTALHASDGTNADFYVDFPSQQITRLTSEFGTNGQFVFANGTGKVERARIDASGNLLVGTTSAVLSNTNSQVLAGSSGYIVLNHISGTGSGVKYEYFGYNGTEIGSITQSGTTAVLYNVTSDQRLKENIVDAPEFGSVIDSIKVRSFDWKTDNTHQRAGFIAQELVTVAPEAVHQPTKEEEMMAVDYSKLVPMLVKEIQSLRKRLADAGI